VHIHQTPGIMTTKISLAQRS